MSHYNLIASRISASLLLATVLTLSGPLHASETGAFIGGVFASKLMNNMERRTQAEQVQAYNSSRAAQPVYQAAPAAAAPAASTPQQKLDQLDKLAAGGYITPDEYKTRRKAILDSM